MGEGVLSDRVPMLQLGEPVLTWSIDENQTKSDENPEKGLEKTGSFFFLVQFYRFLCDVTCFSPILQLQHILDKQDHTRLFGKLRLGRGTDALGRCLCFRELSEQKLI